MFELEKIVSGINITANLSLVLATSWIVIYDFAVWSRSPVIIAKYAENKSNLLEYNDIVSVLLQRASDSVTTRFILESEVATTREERAYKYLDFGQYLNDEQYFYRMFIKKNRAVWFIDSLKSFRRLKADLMNERWHYERNGYFCIIYTGREENRLQSMKIMFQRLFEIYVINVIVLMSVREMVYVYTYYPFTEISCFNTEPIFFNYFDPETNSSFKKPILFNKKLLNMWNCPLVVTTWSEPPFIFVENDNSTGEFKQLSGIEGMLMMLLSEQMNFTMRILPQPNKDRGVVFPNGTVTGALKMLKDQETNITINAMIYDKTRAGKAQPVYSYMSSPMCIGIPKGQAMSPFERIIHPFKYIIWSVLSTSVVLGVLIIYTLRLCFKGKVQAFVFGTGNRIPFTNLWNVFYGGSLHTSLPRRNFARYILAVWIFYTLVLRSAYVSQLFVILQDSRARNSLTTVEQVVAKNIMFYTFPIVVSTLKNVTGSDIKIRFVDTDKHSLPNLLKQLARNEDANIAITVLGHIMRSYNQQEKNREYHINILKQTLFVAPLTFYMPKHSYLTAEVNYLVLNIMSAGLLSKFEELYIASDSFLVETQKEPTLISLWLLSGLFSIYLSLLLLSTLVFLLELWSERSPLTKKFVNFLNL